MRKIRFTKIVASGNDFVVMEECLPFTAGRLPLLARNICDRKYGVGADGLLVLSKSRVADIKMRIFNADGSEAEMCGNGARCVALLLAGQRKSPTEHREPKPTNLKIQTKAGIIHSQINNTADIRIRLTDPGNIKLDIPIRISGRALKVNFLNTGVPHTVIFVADLNNIDACAIGRDIRYHKKFSPAGTNVDFVEVMNKDSIRIRTYERGVEDETLACGTGSVAAAVIFALKSNSGNKINVHTKSGEVLRVYFDKSAGRLTDTWLEGKASVVFRGEFLFKEEEKQ